MKKLHDFISWAFRWFAESHRFLHAMYCMVVAIFFGFGAGVACGITFEVKDVQNNGLKAWDWLDFLASCIGSFFGAIVHIYTLHSTWWDVYC